MNRQVRGSLDDAERAPHRRRPDALHRRPLIGVALRHEHPVDIAGGALFLFRIRDRRTEHLGDVASYPLLREPQRGQRPIHALAANQIHDELGLLGRGPDITPRGTPFDHRHLPLPTDAALSLLLVWPRNNRVGENSPSLCPTMFSVRYTGMNFFPLCTAIV